MTTAGVDPNLASNIELLQKQSLKVEFHLDHTHYKKVENIGTGAYGVVCSAINRKTRQKVAIKKIPNLFTMDPRYAIRTYREIKILQHFKHGNIIAIREILQPANKDISDIYVVMDLMESDLHKIIYSKQSLTDEHVQYFLYQILRGLKYIHSAHVIHRDLKPSNLLVNADCELKIGDFGMARGINFKAEKSNQQMTQYVATRWYRAPELIVASRQGYGAAIDMWSVGCIFAEMLRRKHLFPGRDLLNQLTVIFRTLGIPSKQYLQLLDSETVCGFIRKITDSDEFKPKTYAELCPKASPKAIDLLSKMLVIEPERRIDVEKALTHPFLAKYHDRVQEPRCNTTFDFAFEQELVNLQNDDQKRVKIQELLRKEVLSYRKPQPIDFGALIPSKSTDASQEDNDPYADLNAFLAQLASPAESKAESASHNPLLAATSSKAAANSLLAANDIAVSQHHKEVNPLLQSQLGASSQPNSLLDSQANKPANPLLQQNAKPSNLLLQQSTKPANPLLQNKKPANPLLQQNSKPANPLLQNSKPANPLLQQNNKPGDVPLQQTNESSNSLMQQAKNLPFQKSSYNPLLGGSTQSNPLLEHSHQKLTTTDMKSEKVASDTAVISNVLLATTSESDQSNDTELFNSFIKTQAKKETESKDSLTVNTLAKPASDDIEMISAKLKHTDLDDEKKETVEKEEEVEAKAPDTKSILRQRLMDKQNANAGQANSQDKAPGKTSVTAHQRQKEREERRRKKREKAQEKKKNKRNDNPGQLLTTEDQKMLDRWRQMAKPKHIQPKPSGANNTIVSTGGSNVIVVYPAGAGTTYISSNMPSTVASTNQPSQMPTNNSNQIRMNQPAVVPVNSDHSTSSHPSNPSLPNQMHLPTGQHMHPPNPPLLNQNIPNQMSNTNIQINHQNNHPAANHIQVNQPMGNQLHTNHLVNNQMHMQAPSSNSQQSVNRLPPNSMHPIPGVNSFITSNPSHQRTSHPIRSFSDIAAMHGHTDAYQDQAQETSLYDYNQSVPNTIYPNTSANNHRNNQFSHWSNTMTVSTSLDIGGLVEPKNEDALPPMLVNTPKGMGGGYGVGFDMESMMAFNPDLQNIHMDSAPLSASLLEDWMDVTSNMDPKALDDIQRELELTDFPFSY